MVVTLLCFQSLGMDPDCNEKLYMYVSDSAISGATSLKNFAEILSGPVNFLNIKMLQYIQHHVKIDTEM